MKMAGVCSLTGVKLTYNNEEMKRQGRADVFKVASVLLVSRVQYIVLKSLKSNL